MAPSAEPILLVDDDEIILKICAHALRNEGYEVATASNGQQALQVLAGQHFAAAVVDLVLPDIDGLTIIGALHEADPDMVVVLMTGHASLESAIEAVRRGAYDYLRKPFSASDLSRVVARGLSQRQLTVQNRELLHELDSVNRDLTEKVRQATEELMAFVRLGRRLDQIDGPLPALLDLTSAAAQLTGARSAAIFGGTAASGLRCLVADGHAAAGLRALQLRAEDSLLLRCSLAEKPLIVRDLLADPELATGPLALLGLTSAMALPLIAVSGPVGVMGLFDPAQDFTERQASLVKVIAAQAAEIMALARLHAAAPPPERRDENGFIDLQDLLGAN